MGGNQSVQNWAFPSVKSVIAKVSTTNKKLRQKEYLDEGEIPVIDQGTEFIGGFTNDVSRVLDCALPAIVFGDHTKVVKLIKFKFAPGADGVKVIIPSKAYVPELFFHFLHVLKMKIPDKGYARHFQHVENLNMPLPPLPEQRAIVAKIEQLFSELDDGVASLMKAQEQLKIYRQAVLKKAFEGELTKEWRKKNEPESASALLKRIAERRRPKARPRKEPSFLNSLELNKVPQLPQAWEWVRLGEIFDVFVGATPSRKIPEYWSGEINWVSSGEVSFCKISQTKETITELGLKNTSTSIHDEGTVMLGMIGEGRTRGQAAVLKTRAAHNQNTAAIRVSETECVPELLFYYFFLNYDKTRGIGSGNNQKALNKTRVEHMPYPLIPVAEQQQIVQEIETRLSVCDNVEANIKEALFKAKALRQSILKQAFEGKLLSDRELQEVRGAPDWEPAEELLARVQVEKAKVRA